METKDMTTSTEQRKHLDPGFIYQGLNGLDDVMHAASCLCHLHKDGATIYMRMDPVVEEQYLIQIDVTQSGGARWDVPKDEGWEPLYTIIRRGK